MEINPEGEQAIPEALTTVIADISAFDPVSMVLSILIILVLLLCSALISGSEVSYFGLNESEKRTVATTDSIKAKRVGRLLSKPRWLLATILIANNLVNIGIITTTYVFISKSLPELSTAATFLIEIVGITFLIVLFGEVIPKVYANYHKLKFAAFMSGPLIFLRGLFKPVSFLLVKSTSFLDKRIENQQGENVSLAEIDRAIDLTSRNISTEEVKILKGIVNFGNITVRQIMRSRMDMIAADVSSEFNVVYQAVIDSGYSRIPIYKEDLDTIEGILYAKDLIPHLNEIEKGIDWIKLLRPPLFVPENKKIEELLREFQTKRTHLAIVVDEYGGTSGIVTLEDIMEEIIGEIKDEFDELNEINYQKINASNYIFEGKTLINDFCKVVGAKAELFDKVKGESESLAGLLLEITGKIPVENEEIIFKNYKFIVLAADRKRVEKVKVTLVGKEVESKATA